MTDDHIKQFQRFIAYAEARSKLAQTYAEDAAFASAARCLREAADAYERAHAIRHEALNGTPA